MTVTINGTTGVAGVDGTASTPAIQGNDTNTGIFFPAADTIAFAEGGAEVARFDSSGNLGIGTSSPASLLDVRNGTGSVVTLGNTGSFVGGESSYIKWQEGSTQLADIGWAADTNEVRINNRIAGPTTFYTSNTERMRINSSGQVLVGTATAPSGASYLNSPEITLYNAVNLTEYRQIYYSNSTKYLYFTNGSNSAYLSNTGAWTNASDGRLKNSIVDIAHGLDSVMATQPRSFKFNETEGDYVGFIAQELQTVIPEVVSGDPETQLGVDYGSLVAVAFKAIQEQQAIITDLKARIETLENK